MGNIFKGDIGTAIILDTGEDLTSASAFKIQCRKPSGTSVDWTGIQYQTTMIKYTTVAGDLNEDGDYQLQAVVTGLNGWSGSGEVAHLRVHSTI